MKGFSNTNGNLALSLKKEEGSGLWLAQDTNLTSERFKDLVFQLSVTRFLQIFHAKYVTY